MWKWNEKCFNAKETLGKINEESEGELYKTCSMFLNYMKRKCTMEMKRHEKNCNCKIVRYKWLI